jgi:hypothetical protein
MVKVKVKVLPVLNCHAMKMYGGMEVIAPHT